MPESPDPAASSGPSSSRQPPPPAWKKATGGHLGRVTTPAAFVEYMQALIKEEQALRAEFPRPGGFHPPGLGQQDSMTGLSSVPVAETSSLNPLQVSFRSMEDMENTNLVTQRAEQSQSPSASVPLTDSMEDDDDDLGPGNRDEFNFSSPRQRIPLVPPPTHLIPSMETRFGTSSGRVPVATSHGSSSRIQSQIGVYPDDLSETEDSWDEDSSEEESWELRPRIRMIPERPAQPRRLMFTVRGLIYTVDGRPIRLPTIFRRSGKVAWTAGDARVAAPPTRVTGSQPRLSSPDAEEIINEAVRRATSKIIDVHGPMYKTILHQLENENTPLHESLRRQGVTREEFAELEVKHRKLQTEHLQLRQDHDELQCDLRQLQREFTTRLGVGSADEAMDETYEAMDETYEAMDETYEAMDETDEEHNDQASRASDGGDEAPYLDEEYQKMYGVRYTHKTFPLGAVFRGARLVHYADLKRAENPKSPRDMMCGALYAALGGSRGFTIPMFTESVSDEFRKLVEAMSKFVDLHEEMFALETEIKLQEKAARHWSESAEEV